MAPPVPEGEDRMMEWSGARKIHGAEAPPKHVDV
jgi:hypothetical protein